MFFTFLKLYKWYQIVQNVSYESSRFDLQNSLIKYLWSIVFFLNILQHLLYSVLSKFMFHVSWAVENSIANRSKGSQWFGVWVDHSVALLPKSPTNFQGSALFHAKRPVFYHCLLKNIGIKVTNLSQRAFLLFSVLVKKIYWIWTLVNCIVFCRKPVTSILQIW